MKKFLSLFALTALLSGCASYYHERPMWTSDNTDMINEPAGAEVAADPNPNWDVNARDINQIPYRASGAYRTWGVGAHSAFSTGAAGSAVYTSTDSEKNIGPQIDVERVAP
jgi:hypothetical protein